MRTKLTLFIGLIIGLFVVDKTQAQVLGVNYLMKYNTDSCWYDCYIVVNNGSAAAGSSDAIQFNSQYSIVTLAGDSIEVAASYNPKYNTPGNPPAPWLFSGKVKAPGAQPENDFWGVVPTLGGSTPSRYLNGLNPGDTVKLFSIRKIGNTTLCGGDIRIFENGVDPSSSDPGMGGSAFENGFTLGGPNQLYEANSTQILGPNPLILSADLICTSGIEIDLTATTTACQGPLTYAWTGPSGFSVTTEDVAITPATAANNGTYLAIVTDNIGCVDSIEVEGISKPNAGPDQTVCAGTTGHIITGSPTTGAWTKISGNAQGTTANVSPGVNSVNFSNTASGGYSFRYAIGSTGTCTDTMRFTVNPLPALNMVDNSACIGEVLVNNLVCTTVGATGVWTVVGGGNTIATVTTVNSTTASVSAVGVGSVSFRFTRTSSGCFNDIGPLTVNPLPTIVGVENLCIGGTDALQPNIGGTWTSATPSVATVVPATGVVTAVAAGTSLLTYTDVNGCVDTETQTVLTRPTVSIVGNDSICISGTTTLTSSIAGTWASSHPLIAAVSGNTVTGIAQGAATFILTALGGCTSDPTLPVTVAPDPTASILDNRICDETTTTLTPANGGTWVSSTPSVASVSGNTITAHNNGTSTFTFTNALGCSDDAVLTVDPKPTVSAAQDTMCIGAVNQLSPSTGGSWTNLTPAIVTYNATFKTITGFAEGTANLLFTENTTLCVSDTLDVEVQERPSITYDPSAICIGATKQLDPTSGGVWISSLPSIASVDNTGLVTGLQSGSVTFTFTSSSSNCSSDPTDPIDINPRPIVSVPGDGVLCIGETLQLSATGSSGGTWTSSDPVAAPISSTGLVTATGAGSNIRFTYQDPNGCSSVVSTPIVIKSKPTVNFIGPNTICINGITNVTSNGSVGIWASGTPTVALVNNSGIVTGLSAGTSDLQFTQTDGGCLADPLTVTVAPTPVVVFTGDTLCIGGSITLTATPVTTGSWSSNDGAVATITTGGVITATGAGNTTFVFTSDNGNCPSEDSDPLVVNAPVTINMPESDICIGETFTLLPSTGGTWTSVHDTVATVVGALVTGIGEGLTAFNFVDANGCTSSTSTQLQVNPRSLVNINVDNVCVGLTSQAFPSSGGSWLSANPLIATISNGGVITAVSPGTTTFTYTNTTTTCASLPTETFTVEPGPTISYSGDSTLCIGETANILPATGGTWAIAPSFSTTVASIDNNGLITALAAGFTRFVFTSTATGCKSQPSGPLTVNGKPSVFINGLETICIGATTNLFPSTGGTWISNNTGIASVNNSGLVTGLAEGGATFTFTNTSTGCVSDPTDTLRVSPAPTVGILGDTEICVGGRTELTPSSGGTWTSSAPDVATVSDNGIVSAIAPGVVSFSFSDNIGCGSTSSTAPITISNCTNPDFNATFVDVPVPGDVNTNDEVTISSTYGPSFTLISKPTGSNPTLTLETDGTYSFISSMIGVYKYVVPVCVPPVSIGCPVEDLWITVVDYTEPNNRPVANVDFATTLINTAVTLITLENDGCVVVNGCLLDPASVTIIDSPGRGAAVVNTSTGDITYTPALGESGIDTLLYQVCVQGEPANCATARQFITIVAPTSANTTVADDDFASTPEGQPVSGNVSLNDSDPEGDDFEVIPVTITNAAGSVTIADDGSFTFTPAEYFTGPVDFPYTSFDDNVSPDSQDATLHILVVPDLAIKVRVYLEGSLINALETAPDGRPLMRDNLRNSPFTNTRAIPNKDPYKFQNADYALVGYDITTLFDHVTPGGTINESRFDSVKTANLGIFDVTGQDAIVDWVYVELRSKVGNTTILSTRAGLVQRDGDVVDLDGFSALRYPGVSMDDYRVVVRHRSHFGAMTANAMTPRQLTNLVNFTKDSLPVFDFGTTTFTKVYPNVVNPQTVSGKDFTGLSQNENVIFGYRALWGGDFDGNGKIKFDNPNDDLNQLFFDVLSFPSNTLLNANFDFAYGYLPGDFDMNGKSKYDNPNDDKNFIYQQVLFYPLNSTAFLSNFDFLIEQLP